MWFQASDSVAVSGQPQFDVVFNSTTAPVASSTQQQIATLGTVIPGWGPNQFLYSTAGQTVTSPQIPFSAICGAVTTAGTGGQITTIDANCNQPAGGYAAVTIPLYIIADANGNGMLDSGEDVLGFSLVIQSFIPAASCITATATCPGNFGFYGFETFPGDGEVHLREPLSDGNGSATTTGNTTTEIGSQSVVFFYVTGPDPDTSFAASTFTNVGPVTPSATQAVQGIPVNSAGQLNTYDITGLTDGTGYYFRAAIQDNAGNYGYITCGGGAQCADDVPAADDGFPAAHAAKPDQIVGLLSKNGNCFVATVAYGSPMAGQVQILRRFRDQILMKTEFGKRFVHWYYHNGPTWSERIRHHDTIRAVVRQGLYPFIGFSWLALKIGAFNACLLVTTLLLFPLLILRWKKHQTLLEETR
jgi:hypothetical protein